MTTASTSPRPGALSIAWISTSLGVTVAISLAMDVILLRGASDVQAMFVISAILFNITVIVLSSVGGIIEWRRPGHAIGRLLMLSGPLYALVSAAWLTGDSLKSVHDAGLYAIFFWSTSILSWPAVALIVGWIPLLFPTGALPGPRWRIPVGFLVVLSGIGLVALAIRPMSFPGGNQASPIVNESWAASLQAFGDAIPLELVALIVLAIAALITRYRRGDRVERLQIRWFGAAVSLCGIGAAGTVVQFAVQADGGPLSMTLVLYAGILAIPIAVGIAVTRYRLYELDRLISRTIGWALVTAVLVALFAAAVLALQSLLAEYTQGQTLAIAASTLVAFAAFQPVRRRVQNAVDRRFDRSRYDGERMAAAYAERMRDQVDLTDLEADIAGTISAALRPTSIGIWLRAPSRNVRTRTTS
jgi:hypothetical protein